MTTDFDLDAHLAECRARMKTLTDALLAPGVIYGDEFTNTDGERMFVACVFKDEMTPVGVLLTQDGGWADTSRWHEGEANGWVRAERYSARGMEFHGFVDSLSRRLLQTG